MRAKDIAEAVDSVGKSWTRQIKQEERQPSTRSYRGSMYAGRRVSLKDVCYEHMEEAWAKASDDGRLPTHWRQVFYVMRPICQAEEELDRPLRDSTFKNILEDYLEEYSPGWDILRGARGVFKEPYRAKDDTGLAMSTMAVRNYLRQPIPDGSIDPVDDRFPTAGPRNRISAILICEKEGFDELLEAEKITSKFDLALMSTKGVSAFAARELAESLDVPTFTLHDLDLNGFVMAAGFPDAVDIGVRLDDVEKWGLEAEEQTHRNERKAYRNLLQNGATIEEAEFISGGLRAELNMFTSAQFIEYVVSKLEENGVEKVMPDTEILSKAWRRALLGMRVNDFIVEVEDGGGVGELDADVSDAPDDLEEQIREALDEDPTQSWDEALWSIAEKEE